ncbi:MAG: hypothetical protein HZA50_14160, partial [Planctomycetes bacterium]|nr:hypothetical protein [Planctomycetota bacterium]
ASALEQKRSQSQQLPSARPASCRHDALAFLNTSPQRQQELLAGYDELISMDPQKRAELAAKARQVAAVIKTLSPAQIEAFMKAQPAEQAKIVEKQKDALREKGLLPENP